MFIIAWFAGTTVLIVSPKATLWFVINPVIWVSIDSNLTISINRLSSNSFSEESNAFASILNVSYMYHY